MPAQSPGGTEGFTAQERAALKARAAELKAEARRARDADKAAAEPADVLAKIAEMPEGDRSLAERVHAAVLAAAPSWHPSCTTGSQGTRCRGKCCVSSAAGRWTRSATPRLASVLRPG